MKKNALIIILIFFSLALNAFPISTEELAKKAYNEKNYDKAVELFNEAMRQDSLHITSSMLYNLGNAYYGAKDYSGAVIAYSRALRLDPNDSQIKSNLDYVLSKVEDKNSAPLKGSSVSAAPDDSSILTTIRKSISNIFHSDVWAAWALFFFILTLSGVALYIFPRNILLRKIGFFGALSAFGISIIMLFFAFMAKNTEDRKDECVLTSESAVLINKAGGEPGKNDNTIYNGTLLQIIGEEDDASGIPAWYKVRLNANFVGWVKASEIEII